MLRDLRSNLLGQCAFNAAISSNTTTNGAILDMADYALGAMFTFLVPTFTDGSYTVNIQHGDDSGLSDAASVPSDNLIGAYPTLTAATSQGSTVLKTVGFFGAKRYVRLQVISTGVTTGARVEAVLTKMAEIRPTISPSS